MSLLQRLRAPQEGGRVNLRIGPISRYLSPGWGACFRCRTTWRFVRPHMTYYRHGRGMFPLCEKCWQELTPEGRLPFYEQLLSYWRFSGGAGSYTDEEMAEDWPLIQAAVREERT